MGRDQGSVFADRARWLACSPGVGGLGGRLLSEDSAGEGRLPSWDLLSGGGWTPWLSFLLRPRSQGLASTFLACGEQAL